MKLQFDGKTRQYHPASGLDLWPGEHEYPDDATDDLLAAGLTKAKDPLKVKAAKLRKQAAEIEKGK
jgi:hypothetical protein